MWAAVVAMAAVALGAPAADFDYPTYADYATFMELVARENGPSALCQGAEP